MKAAASIPQASVGIVYAQGSKALRRIIVDAPDLAAHLLAPGEAMLVADVSDIAACKAAVQKATGVYPPDPLCAVVSNGVVVGLTMADPALDAHPDGELVTLAKPVSVGATFDSQSRVFTEPVLPVVPAKVRPGVAL